MKPDRLMMLLAGLLLLTAGRTANAGKIVLRFPGVTATFESSSAKLAQELARQVKVVDETFRARRSELRILRSGTAAGYDPTPVADLIVHTQEDLSRAIQQVGKSDLVPLDAWEKDKLQEIRSEIPKPAPIASLPEPSASRAAAVFAGSRGFGLPMLAANKPASKKPKPAPPKPPEPPKPQGIPVSVADQLLDRAEGVIRQIFTLADTNDLWVDVWAGSTPSEKALFSFWAHGVLKDSDQARAVIKTDNWKKHMARGFYDYEIRWPQGAVTQTIRYPDPAAPIPSERLDLVQGSPFFCCEFDKSGNCHHVEDKKDCR